MATALPGLSILGAAIDAFTITPSDATNYTQGGARGLYIGGSGNVSLVTPQGSVVSLVGVVTGTVLNIRSVRINSTGTTATNLVGLM